MNVGVKISKLNQELILLVFFLNEREIKFAALIIKQLYGDQMKCVDTSMFKLLRVTSE